MTNAPQITATTVANLDALRLVDTAAAAEILQLNGRTLENWRSLGRGPKHVKVGGRVRYRVSELKNYLDSQTRQHTGDSDPCAA